MEARAVATPVLALLAAGSREGAVRGATRAVAYLDLGGFVAALTAPGTALMPNGVAVARTAVPDGRVRATAGAIEVAGERVTWDAAEPPRWDPVPRRAAPDERAGLAARGTDVLAALGAPADPWAAGGLATTDGPRAAEGTAHLRRALRERDPAAAAAAAERLAGLGAGLTPEGDDVLTAVAAVVATTGDAVGFTGAHRDRWLEALCLHPAERAERTTSLSATLLGLARDGAIAEPVHPLLDPARARWPEALDRLTATGASTGRAYALAVGATLALLTATATE